MLYKRKVNHLYVQTLYGKIKLGTLNIKDLKIQEAKFLTGKFEITLKRDGTLMYWRNGTLVSDRGIVRSNRFPHIVKALQGFPECKGELYVENGNVFNITSTEGWPKAKFMPFEIEGKFEGIDGQIEALHSEHITKPVRFNSIQEGWDYVIKTNGEGLILRNKYEWYKVKILKECKLPIKSWEQGKTKGAFILEGDQRISATGDEFIMAYQGITSQGKIAVAEFEYPFMTEQGHYFQPRLRRVVAEEEI